MDNFNRAEFQLFVRQLVNNKTAELDKKLIQDLKFKLIAEADDVKIVVPKTKDNNLYRHCLENTFTFQLSPIAKYAGYFLLDGVFTDECIMYVAVSVLSEPHFMITDALKLVALMLCFQGELNWKDIVAFE